MPKHPDYFVGKTIIITGAASGIGRATALIFARERANVVCADIDGEGAQRTAGQVSAQGAKALPLRIDVTSRAEVNDMAQQAIDTFGKVQFLFNSAGAALRRVRFLEIDDALLDRQRGNLAGKVFRDRVPYLEFLKIGLDPLILDIHRLAETSRRHVGAHQGE